MIIRYIKKFPIIKTKLKELFVFASIIFAKINPKKGISKCKSWKIPFYKSLASNNQRIILLREDSHIISTLEKVKEVLNNRKINIADGDYTFLSLFCMTMP